MRKLSTGTPDTGDPYVRCGGRGGHMAIPTPIEAPCWLNHFGKISWPFLLLLLGVHYLSIGLMR